MSFPLFLSPLLAVLTESTRMKKINQDEKGSSNLTHQHLGRGVRSFFLGERQTFAVNL